MEYTAFALILGLLLRMAVPVGLLLLSGEYLRRRRQRVGS